MILVNILALVALASSILMLMLSGEAAAVDGSVRFREASQAAVLARAGELSAAVALRRDALEAPEADHLGEAWAKVIEREAAIEGGTFSLSITDAQSRFNLNNLVAGPLAAAALEPIAAALQLDPAVTQRIGQALQQGGPMLQLSQLREFGVDDETIARLAPLVTTLPASTTLNLNTASEPLIALLTRNPAAARMLISQRERTGSITQDDVRSAGVLLPPGVGFTSDFFWVRTTVTIGDTPQTVTSLVQRRVRDGQPEIVTLGRWRGQRAPDQMSVQ